MYPSYLSLYSQIGVAPIPHQSFFLQQTGTNSEIYNCLQLLSPNGYIYYTTTHLSLEEHKRRERGRIMSQRIKISTATLCHLYREDVFIKPQEYDYLNKT